jgi:hypothetical protein
MPLNSTGIVNMKKSLITVLLLTLYGCGGGGETDKPPIPVEPSSYSVSTSTGTGGSITPSSQNVISGNTTTFTIIAESGYSIVDATGCGGSLSGATYTTDAISADCEVATTFTLDDVISSYTLTGNFEKGPFIIGSEITIQEFDDNLVSTGKTFHTETISNTGNYNMDLSLTEELVEVSADGYYFNEISGELSNSKLRLSALANASDNENININILTHLSKKRIKTLVSDGKYFSVAKKQAEEEVQELFSFVAADWEINDFDRMSLSESGDNNAYLLLVSAIIQNINMSTSQLSEYIERLAQDLSDNGVVNDSSLIESINSSAQTVNLSVVRTNLTTRYDELGESVNLPDFELLLNRQPIANAGEDLTGLVGGEVTLDGSQSTDIDGDNLTYQWTLIESPVGSIASLSNENSISPSLTPDMLGSYSIGLTVHDGELSSDVDVVVISPENQLPVSDAGEDFSIVVGESLTLDGSNSYDPEGEPLTYQWTSLYCRRVYIGGVYGVKCDPYDIGVSGTSKVFEAGVIQPPMPITYDDYNNRHEPTLPKIIFILSVTDSHGLSSEASITVTYTPILNDNNDGTVSDGFGNMWQQGEKEMFSDFGSFPDSVSYCSNLIIGQYDDWRLPVHSELLRLLNLNVGSPTIDTNVFPTAKSNNYVTINSTGAGPGDIVKLNFDNGSWYPYDLSGTYPLEQKYYAKCIR